MKIEIKIFSFIIVLFLTNACVSFKTQKLYFGEIAPVIREAPNSISLFVEPVIFQDDITDVWGLEKNYCVDNKVNKEIFYTGSKSLELSWNRGAENCDWGGIGIGWDRYIGKDLSEIIDFAAIQFKVRTKSDFMFSLPFVLTFEDYSGGMGFCYTANKYFERSKIDEKWQNVTVPLADFDIEIEKLDITNVKQLMIEFQQSGSVFIDDIKLILFEPTEFELYMIEEERPNPTNFPIILFNDSFINNNGWGISENKCQKIELSNQIAFESQNSIYINWDHNKKQCAINAFGVSWNRWFPTDISSVLKTGAVQFMFNGNKDFLANISIEFEDYERKKSTINLSKNYIVNSINFNDWNLIQVPLSEFPIKTIDFKSIKHIQFTFSGKGNGYIDKITLIKL